MWEEIPDKSEKPSGSWTFCLSARLQVPEGWIVRTIYLYGRGPCIAQTFVQDKNHDWKLSASE